MFSYFLKLTFKLIVAFNLHFLIAIFYVIKTKTLGSSKNKEKKFKILALNQKRFRGDLELLEKDNFSKIYFFSFEDQSRFILHFFNKDDASKILLKNDFEFKNKENLYLEFLKKVLKFYFFFNKIDAVIGAAVHYKQDIHWGIASHQLKVPYIVLHKECLYASHGSIRDVITKRLITNEKFRGTHVLVHNNIVKETWVKSNFIDANRITVAGALRFWPFIKRKNLKKEIDLLFFSFGPGSGLQHKGLKVFDNIGGFKNIYKKTHQEVFLLAKNNPELNIVVKLKWGGSWFKQIKNLSDEIKLDLDEIKNLKIEDSENSHDLILKSKIVLAFNTTAILEASIKNKIVIIPFFGKEKDTLKDFFFFRDYFKYFILLKSPTDMSRIIKAELKKKNKYLTNKKLLFSKYVSPINKNSESITKKIMENIILEKF